MNYQDIAQFLIDEAKKRQIEDVEVYIEDGESFQVNIRQQEIEHIENSIERGLGLRLFKEKKTSFTHTSDLSKTTLLSLLDIAVENLKLSDQAEYNCLPPHQKIESQNLDLYDETGFKNTTEEKINFAKAIEQFSLDDKRITNSNGASFSESKGQYLIANSNGVCHGNKESSYGFSVSPVAGEGDAMQTNYWYSYHRHFKKLESIESVAKIANERTTRLIGARKIDSCEVPVLFENTVASSLLGIVLSAINGNTVFKNESFLANALEKEIAASHLHLYEDPFILQGIGSETIDGEGLPTTFKDLIKDGYLHSYLHNHQSATKMKTVSTGNAVRSYSSTPGIGTTNVHLKPGSQSLDQLIKSVDRGLLLTGFLGSGMNMITGDFSRGAEGLWIENGEIQYPVNEITVAGNLKDILKHIVAVGSDLNPSRSTSSPSFLVEKMTISGK